LSEDNRLIQVWQNGLQAYIGLTLIPIQDGDVETQIDDYLASHYSEDAFTFIDEATAPDGSLRRSYRLFGEVDPPFEDGQIDSFFVNRGTYLVVLELYSSDTLGNGIVPDYQHVLDSLRINDVPEGA
jgi:hypothetical protein